MVRTDTVIKGFAVLTGIHDGLFVDNDVAGVSLGPRYSRCDSGTISLEDDSAQPEESASPIRAASGSTNLGSPIIDTFIRRQKHHIQPLQHRSFLDLSPEEQAHGIMKRGKGE